MHFHGLESLVADLRGGGMAETSLGLDRGSEMRGDLVRSRMQTRKSRRNQRSRDYPIVT